MASSASGQDEPNPALRLATRASGQDGAILPLGIARFVSAITFRGCTKIFCRKIFSVTVKRFSVISLSGWNYIKNEKIETRYHFCI